ELERAEVLAHAVARRGDGRRGGTVDHGTPSCGGCSCGGCSCRGLARRVSRGSDSHVEVHPVRVSIPYHRAMGLRERKVERTRTALATAAIELFLAEGYEATTMEQIAERAELGSSTLYRHFPTKDLLLLDWFVRRFDLAAALRERPDDEPLPIALRRA